MRLKATTSREMDFEGYFAAAYEQLLRGSDNLRIPGLKMLWCDEHALSYMSTMCTQTRLSNDDVALTQPLERVASMAALPHVNALVLCQPSKAAEQALNQVLQSDRKKVLGLYVVFTQVPSDQTLERLAQADRHGLVKSVKVQFVDYVPVLPTLVLANSEQHGLESVLLGLGQMPSSVRYMKQSRESETVARRVSSWLFQQQGQGLFLSSQQQQAQRKKPLEVIVMESKTTGREQFMASLNVLQLAHERKSLQSQSKLPLKSGEEIIFNYFQYSAETRRSFLMDAFQALQKLSDFKKNAMQKAPENMADLQAQQQYLAQQDAIRTEQNEYRQLGQFLTEDKDLNVFLLGFNNVQQQMMANPGQKMPEEPFHAMRQQLQRKETAEDILKQRMAKLCALGTYCVALALQDKAVASKSFDSSLKVLTEFSDFLNAFAPSQETEFLGRELRLLRKAATPVFDWAPIHAAAQMAKGISFAQFPKPPLEPQVNQGPLNQYRKAVTALAEAALGYKLPQDAFPIVDAFRGPQAEIQASGETPQVLIWMVDGTRFDDAVQLAAFDDGEISRAVAARACIASWRVLGAADAFSDAMMAAPLGAE